MMTDHGHAPDSLYQRDDRADIGLGHLITLTVAVILCTAGIVTANGTIWPGVLTGLGIGLAVRLLIVTLRKGAGQ